MMSDEEAIKDIYERYKNVDIQKDKFFKKKIRMHNPITRYVAIILCIILLSSSITIGNNFFNYYSKNKVGYLDNELYEQMQDVSMEYQKSNDVGVKITNVLVDNSKIYLVFDFKFYEPLTENVHRLKMPDLLITDESDNVIYCDNMEKYKVNFAEGSSTFNENVYNNAQILTTSSNSQFIEKTPEHIQYLIILNTDNTYPNSKKIYIDFTKLLLSIDLTTYENISEKTIEKNGKWNLEIDLSK